MKGAGHLDKIFRFVNCSLIRDGEIVKDDLWVRNGIIVNPEPIFYQEKAQCDYIIDCKNSLIAPGFIDVQLNGGYGYDFSYDAWRLSEALSTVRKNILSAGVTSFCPTVVTSSENVYHKVLPEIKKVPGDKDGAGILGVHLEGPFISNEKKGAHSCEFIRDFTEGVSSIYKIYGDLSNVAMVTLAPELDSTGEIIEEFTKRGIVVSLGHSIGNILDGERAVDKGASFITHLFNAMLPFHHRLPGLVGLLTSQFVPEIIYYGIIADGIHTHPAALRLAHKTYPEGLVLVTDAMAALGLGDGFHQIGQMEVEVKGREAYIRDTKTLAGSITPMDECIRRFMKAARVGIVEGIEAAALHPARALGIHQEKGTLDFGSDADFVLLCPHPFRVLHTFIGGECVYSCSDQEPIVFRPRE